MTYVTNINKKTIPSPKKGKIWRILGVLAIFGIAFLYLTLINTTASKTFAAKELSGKVNKLQEENAKLKGDVSDLSSLSQIEKKVKDLGLVPVEKADYAVQEETVVFDR